MSESGAGSDRLAWLELAIADTTRFCEAVEANAEAELEWTRFDTVDYDFEVDLNHQAKLARKTLSLMEEERASILTRQRMRAQRQADETRRASP